MKRYLLLLSFFFASAYNYLLAESLSYILTKDGVIVFTDPVFTGVSNAVKLEVVSDNIIRVTVAPGKEIMPVQNLVTVYSKNPSLSWDVVPAKDSLVLKTKKLTAVVDQRTGVVVFRDDAWYGLGQHQDGILMRGLTKRFYIKGRK